MDIVKSKFETNDEIEHDERDEGRNIEQRREGRGRDGRLTRKTIKTKQNDVDQLAEPCARIDWKEGHSHTRIVGVPLPLISSSTNKCLKYTIVVVATFVKLCTIRWSYDNCESRFDEAMKSSRSRQRVLNKDRTTKNDGRNEKSEHTTNGKYVAWRMCCVITIVQVCAEVDRSSRVRLG